MRTNVTEKNSKIQHKKSTKFLNNGYFMITLRMSFCHQYITSTERNKSIYDWATLGLEILKIYLLNKDKWNEIACKCTKFSRSEGPIVARKRKFIAKVLKLVSLDLSAFVQCICSKILHLWLKVFVIIHQPQFVIVLKKWNFHTPLDIKYYEKISMFGWFKIWKRMTICFVFASLDEPTSNCTMSVFSQKR